MGRSTWAGAVLVATALAYAAVAGAGIIWDDRGMVFAGPLVDVRWEALAQPYGWDPAEPSSASPYWRPVTTASILLDHALGGTLPAMHLHNLAWHLLATGLLYALARIRLAPAGAALAAAFFALHPVQAESVAWLSARGDLMAGAFLLGGTWLLARDRPVLAAPALLAAVLAKEVAWVAPVFVPCVLAALGRPVRPRDVAVPALAVAAAVLVRESVPWAAPDAALTAYASVLAAAWLVLPWPLTSVIELPAYVPEPVHYGAALAALLLVAWILRGPSALRAGWLVPAAALAWGVTVPAVWTSRLAAERYLYLPLALVGLALAGRVSRALLEPLGEAADRRAAALLLAFAAPAVVALQLRLPEWRDESTFFAAAMERSPTSRAYTQYGTAQEREGDPRGAFRTFVLAARMPHPSEPACRAPVNALARVGAAAPAVDLGLELVAGPCGEHARFRDYVLRGTIEAGRLDAARALAARSPSVPLDTQAALCALDGNVRCAEAAYAQGGTGVRAEAEALIAAARAAGAAAGAGAAAEAGAAAGAGAAAEAAGEAEPGAAAGGAEPGAAP